MEDIIGILLYNQTFRENKDTLNSPGHVKQGEKNMLDNALPTTVSNRTTQKTFLLFCFRKLKIRNVIPTSKLRETQGFLGFMSAINRGNRSKA